MLSEVRVTFTQASDERPERGRKAGKEKVCLLEWIFSENYSRELGVQRTRPNKPITIMRLKEEGERQYLVSVDCETRAENFVCPEERKKSVQCS